MLKRIPYEQYEIFKIEQWLNFQAEQGYKLTQLYGAIAQFEKYNGVRYHYRVKYIPYNKQCTNTLYWGDLYVYESKTLEDLPQPNSENDIITAAKRVATLSVFDVIAYITSIALFCRVAYICFDFQLYLVASGFSVFAVAYCWDHSLRLYKAHSLSKKKRNFTVHSRQTLMPFATIYFIVTFILQFTLNMSK